MALKAKMASVEQTELTRNAVCTISCTYYQTKSDHSYINNYSFVYVTQAVVDFVVLYTV